ncbi:PREDICTED: testis-expressed sequence 264 protein-like [Rhagoletis zephyria]|uniref:testis-expressed sequence 264 protein-like n=1 Tax=Rhagoletis zephyria TaxID=28612 RepID=UPI00081132E8|nr:PREDICTED: testis-expressed sequence 264 protein-like [Rhagoletis zephyria]
MALVATVAIALIYFGIFDRVEVSTGAPPFAFAGAQLAYKIGKGKPGDSGALFTEVCSIVPRKTTLGMFLELEEATEPEQPISERRTRATTFRPTFNPAADDCHYLVGVITTDSAGQEVVTEADRALLTEKGFKFATLPGSENVVFSKFPYRGIVSVVVGLRRVYPSLLKYITEHRLCAYPALEIYDRDTIYYVLPLSQQSQFVALFETAEAGNQEEEDEDQESGDEDDDTEIDEEAYGEEADGDDDSEAANSFSSFEEL